MDDPIIEDEESSRPTTPTIENLTSTALLPRTTYNNNINNVSLDSSNDGSVSTPVPASPEEVHEQNTEFLKNLQWSNHSPVQFVVGENASLSSESWTTASKGSLPPRTPQRKKKSSNRSVQFTDPNLDHLDPIVVHSEYGDGDEDEEEEEEEEEEKEPTATIESEKETTDNATDAEAAADASTSRWMCGLDQLGDFDYHLTDAPSALRPYFCFLKK